VGADTIRVQELQDECEEFKRDLTNTRRDLANKDFECFALMKQIENLRRDYESVLGNLNNISSIHNETEEHREELEIRYKAAEKVQKKLIEERDMLALQLQIVQQQLLSANQELSISRNKALWDIIDGSKDSSANDWGK
jgi:septal ring factor EnvC (AmiA/AmiB activator)